MQRVAPEFGQRCAIQCEGFAGVEVASHFGLAAGHQHHEFGVLGQSEGDGVVSRGVAGMQGRDDVNLPGQLAGLGGLGYRQVQERHAVKPETLCQLAGLLHQLGARFNAVDVPLV